MSLCAEIYTGYVQSAHYAGRIHIMEKKSSTKMIKFLAVNKYLNLYTYNTYDEE